MKHWPVLLCLALPLVLVAEGLSAEEMMLDNGGMGAAFWREEGPSAEEIALYKAITHGALIMEHICVVDQDGLPIEEAKIWGGLQTGYGYNDYTPLDGYTDTNGEFVAKGKCTNFLTLRVTKDGYYETHFRFSYHDTTAVPKVKDGKWQPYDSRRTIILKKIVNPQPMFFQNARTSFKVPVYEEWVGFDCERYDFVSPHGNGKENDMLLRFTLDNPVTDDYHMTMEVSFTNNPHAGAYEMERTGMSEFESVYHADTNAVYQQSFMYRFDKSPSTVPEYTVQLKSDKYLVFRTRTQVDAEGRLVSALYGKIYGEWNFAGPGGMSMAQFVFNPRPNDTNLEDEHTAEYSRKRQRHREEPPYEKKRKSLWPF